MHPAASRSEPVSSAASSAKSGDPAASQPPAAMSRRIRKLDEATINKIAAAEIVQRPSSAAKELLENALDSGASRIQVTAKEGGLKLLSIQDDGSGIHKDDLPLLCERFATSKIQHFDDLRSLNSFGFRGEALASISHVARLSCTTKRKEEPVGYKAVYSDGKMIPAAGRGSAEPKPTAATNGTHLLVEDLFFNNPIRRSSLRSGSEEYARLLAVVSKYSIHNAGIAMSCKKAGTSSLDLNTTAGASVADNIAHVYGEAARRDLIRVEVPRKQELSFSATGWCSGANFSGKKHIFLLFINNRLVNCTSLRKGVEAFYATLLPKGAHPCVYLSLTIDPQKIDVNVHPTKHEVAFEDEDEIVQEIVAVLSTTLSEHATSRRFAASQAEPRSAPVSTESSQSLSRSSSYKSAPQKVIRTDSTARTLDGMFGFAATQGSSANAVAGPSRQSSAASLTPQGDEAGDEDAEMPPPPGVKPAAKPAVSKAASAIKLTKCNLASVQQLRRGVENAVHHDLQKIISNHIYVGMVGLDRPESLLQHETKLYLVDHVQLAEELFYQLGLRQFGRIGKLRLDPQPALADLLSFAVACEADAQVKSGLSHDELVQTLTAMLLDRRDMLGEYFSLVLDESGSLEAIPLLLPQYKPNLDKLPLFLLRAALQTDWTSEKECFDSFLRELALLYAPSPLLPTASEQEPETADGQARFSEVSSEDKWQIQHVLFPAMQRYLIPPVKLVNKANAVKQVASMESLFKVFERC